MGRVIGIDLGTSNSAAAVMEGGRPVIIPSAEGAGVSLSFTQVVEGKEHHYEVRRTWNTTPSGTREHVEVLHHRRQRHGERCGDLCDRQLAFAREAIEDGAAGRVGQGLEPDGERDCLVRGHWCGSAQGRAANGRRVLEDGHGLRHASMVPPI